MKMILRSAALLLAAAAAMSSSAHFDLNNIRYSTCYTCTTDQDYRNFAQAQYEQLGGISTMVIADGNHHFWLNNGTLSGGTIKQVQRVARMSVNWRSGEPVHTFTVSYNIVPVSSAAMDFYNDFIAELNSYLSQGSPQPMNLGAPLPTVLAKNIGAVDITVNGAIWLNNTDFMADYTSAINTAVNNALAAGSVNPFYFTDKPLVARFNTADNYSVEVVRHNGQWTHLFTWETGTQALMDQQGNFMDTEFKFKINSVCTTKLTISFCRDQQGLGNLIHVLDVEEEERTGATETPGNHDDSGNARRCQVDNCGYP